MAGTKRKSDEVELLTRPELLNKIYGMSSLRNQALAVFIYLTGCRISEILGTMKVKGLYKESIEVLQSEDLILIHNVPCLKRRDSIPRRTIPIVISQETQLVNIFLSYYNHLAPESKLFEMTRQRAWQIINKELGIYNHFLIHERCTHLVTYKSFTDQDLKQFRGWSNSAPASKYTHLNYRDIANKMR